MWGISDLTGFQFRREIKLPSLRRTWTGIELLSLTAMQLAVWSRTVPFVTELVVVTVVLSVCISLGRSFLVGLTKAYLPWRRRAFENDWWSFPLQCRHHFVLKQFFMLCPVLKQLKQWLLYNASSIFRLSKLCTGHLIMLPITIDTSNSKTFTFHWKKCICNWVNRFWIICNRVLLS